MSKRIESEKVNILCSTEKVYNFISNFDHFSDLLPEQVENWQSSGDACSFEVKGLATIGLRITSKTPFSNVSMKGEGKLPFNFTFEVNISEIAPQESLVQIVIDSDMNQFIAMMAAKPLQNFVDILVSKLKMELEK